MTLQNELKNRVEREKAAIRKAKKEAEKSLTPDQERDQLIAEGIEDPCLFSEVFLNQDLWSVQEAILRSVAKNPKTVVKACHSSGKTKVASCAALWWLARWPDGIVVTTAPTDLQVRKLLWGEINTAVSSSLYPFPLPNQTELKIAANRYAIGFATSVTQGNQGVRFQGFHSGHILIILDEAPGVHPAIWDAIEGIRAGGMVSVLALGNPTINSGPFFDAFGSGRSGVTPFTISAFDCPNFKGIEGPAALLSLGRSNPEALAKNVRPYLTTRQWVFDRLEEWGPEHPSFASRVLGQFPYQSDSSLMSLTWLELAKLRVEKEDDKGPIDVGLDVAGPGEDETVLAARSGNRFLSVDAWPNEDPRGEVVAKLESFGDRLRMVNVDSVGIGWGMYLHLRDRFGSNRVTAVNVGVPSTDAEKYVNLKAELYWGLRLRFKDGDVWGLTDDKTIGQLAGIRYELNPRGQTMIEKKDDARKRGVKSPDRAEACMLAFAKPLKPGAGLLEWMKEQTAAASNEAPRGAAAAMRLLG
jgi:phage terminase large subunit